MSLVLQGSESAARKSSLGGPNVPLPSLAHVGAVHSCLTRSARIDASQSGTQQPKSLAIVIGAGRRRLAESRHQSTDLAAARRLGDRSERPFARVPRGLVWSLYGAIVVAATLVAVTAK